MKLIPEYSLPVTLDQVVENGRPARSSDLAEVDHYQTWLAMCAHPMTATIICGAAEEAHVEHDTSMGFRTTSGSFGDLRYVEILVPPFVNWMQWGVTFWGSGQIRANALGGSNDYIMKLSHKDESNASPADNVATAWAINPMQVFASDVHAAIDLIGGGHTGSKIPRLATFSFQIKKTSGNLNIYAIHFRYLMPKPGTDVSAFSNSGAGGTDL